MTDSDDIELHNVLTMLEDLANAARDELKLLEYDNSSKEFLRLDGVLLKTNGFGNLTDLPEYAKAKKKWQIATNNYWGFLSYIKGKDINPNDEFLLV